MDPPSRVRRHRFAPSARERTRAWPASTGRWPSTRSASATPKPSNKPTPTSPHIRPIFPEYYGDPEECARLDAEDFAITARTGEVRLHGKGDEVRSVPLSRRARDRVSAWLDERGRHPRPAWHGQRGLLTISGITQVVLVVGADAGIPGLRPHRCRHSFATRLRQGGADPAQVQALLGHASVDTPARYFRSGSAENAAVIERVFSD